MAAFDDPSESFEPEALEPGVSAFGHESFSSLVPDVVTRAINEAGSPALDTITLDVPYEQLPGPEAPPLDDAEATRLFGAYETLPLQARDRVDRQFEDYFAKKREAVALADNRHFHDLFLDPKKEREFYESPGGQAATATAADPNLLYKEQAVNAYMAHESKRELSPMEAEAARHEWGRRIHGRPRTSIGEAFDLAQEQYKTQDAWKAVHEADMVSVAADVLRGQLTGAGTNKAAVFDTARKAHPELIKTPQDEMRLYASIGAIYDRTRQVLGDALPAAATTYDVVQKTIAGTATDDDLARATDALLSIPDKSRQNALGVIVATLKQSGADVGVIDKVMGNAWKVVSRGFGGTLEDFGSAYNDLELSQRVRAVDRGDLRIDAKTGKPVWIERRAAGPYGTEAPIEPEGSRLATEDEAARVRADLLRMTKANQIGRELKQAREEIDPYRAILGEGTLGWIEKGVYHFAEQAPSMALYGVPVVGTLLGTTAIASRNYRSLKLENPEMNTELALGISGATSVVESALEKLQFESMMGHGVAAKNLLATAKRDGAQGLAAKLGLAGKLFLGTVAEQNIQEAAQDASNAILGTTIQAVAKEINPEVDAGTIKTLDTLTAEFLAGRADVAAMLFLPSLIGAGAATMRHIKSPVEQVLSPENLAMMGVPPEAQAKILTEPDVAKQSEHLRAAIASRTEEDKASGAAARAEFEQRQLAQPAATIEAVTDANGERKFNVKNADGTTRLANVPENVALDSVAEAQEQQAAARLGLERQQAASEEGWAAQAEAEAELSVLPPEERTSARVVFDFADRPETGGAERAMLDAFHRDLAARGAPATVKLVEPAAPATREAANVQEFIDGWQALTGKRVQWVDSATDAPLDFTGAVSKSTPGVIWLNAKGDRNIAALVGHEWTHTLKTDNPALYAELTSSLRPLVSEMTEIAPAEVTDELVANVVGDGFTDPQFWRVFEERNPGLFRRVIDSIKAWFDGVLARARESEFGTDAFIEKAEEVRNVIARTIESHLRAPRAEAVAAETTAGAPGTMFAGRRAKAAETKAKSGLEAFAGTVMEAAQAIPAADRFGRKAFIAHVWQRLPRKPEIPASYFEFKKQLISANRAGLIGMSRMDLMIPRLREIRDASVVEDAGSTWHFIDLETEGGPPAAMFAGWRAKLAEAKAEGVDRRASVDAALDRMNRGPDERLEMLARARERLEAVRAANEIQQTAAEWGPPDKAEWDRMRKVHALGELNAILRALPPEVRGRVGGMGRLIEIGTSEEALTSWLASRIAIIDRELERHTAIENRNAIDRLREMAEPKGKPGEKAIGKIGPEAHRDVAMIESVIAMTATDAEARRNAVLESINNTDTSDTQTLMALANEMAVLETFGGYEDLTAEQLGRAHAFLRSVYDGGRAAWRMQEEARLEQVRQDRDTAQAGAGGVATDAAMQARKEADKSLVRAADGLFASLFSFEQLMQATLGRENRVGRELIAKYRAGTAAKTSRITEFRRDWETALERIFPGLSRLARRRAVFDLQQAKNGFTVTKMEGRKTKTEVVPRATIERILSGDLDPASFGMPDSVLPQMQAALAAAGPRQQKFPVTWEVNPGTPTPTQLSQMEAVHMSMTYAQEQYRDIMESWGWTAATMAEIESKLSPEAKAIRAFAGDVYRGQWHRLNPVFNRMHGIDLPQIRNYAPGTFHHAGQEAREMDPMGLGMIPSGGTRAGMLRQRKDHNAEPRIEDAISQLFGHIMHTEHWAAFAEVNRDARSILLSPSVKKSIEATSGNDYQKALGQWIEAHENNGIAQKAGWGRIEKWLRKSQGAQAFTALAYNLGTLLKQFTAVFGSIADMPVAAYWRGFARLMGGQIDWRSVFRSKAIQSRIEGGFSPEMRIAMNVMQTERPGWATAFVEAGMRLIAWTDALSTTFSASIARDYHFRRAMESGMPEHIAAQHADAMMTQTIARTAQPAEMMDRSILEIGMNPLQRSFFMFASDSRQKMALEYAAIKEVIKTGSPEAKRELGRTIILTRILIPLVTQSITAMWRDARDDSDDEVFDLEHWNPMDFAAAMMIGPIDGIPILGDFGRYTAHQITGTKAFSHNVFTQVEDAWNAKGQISKQFDAFLEGEDIDWPWTLTAVRRLANASALALGRDDATAIAILTRMVEQSAQVGANAWPEQNE